ncbi:hypothetical protein NDU88_000534 [Pleurodeles waltl]|uniref:Uncharacterized protein n=1 Tax=Pleurodeles waltl TaxID=8319 RepID=A0AAV7LF07_PLEWA|nr:hypothetical protein NDU88_000534 [Pleurodeles waltl]
MTRDEPQSDEEDRQTWRQARAGTSGGLCSLSLCQARHDARRSDGLDSMGARDGLLVKMGLVRRSRPGDLSEEEGFGDSNFPKTERTVSGRLGAPVN